MGAGGSGWLAQTQVSQQLFPLRGVALASPCSSTETVDIPWSKNRTFMATSWVLAGRPGSLPFILMAADAVCWPRTPAAGCEPLA